MKLRHKILAVFGLALLAFALKTYADIRPVNKSLHQIVSDAQKLQVLARDGKPLNFSYLNEWNIYDNLPLHEIPDFLQKAFVVSEDKRFYTHKGVDWKARASAILQDIKHRKTVRGASTISEQVARMITPRPRNLWSKWIEGFEANILEDKFSKSDILEFYLNQIPYASNRRGVLQASRYYFNRDLNTLTKKEMLALVVLARAPSYYDLYKNQKSIEDAVTRLADKLGVAQEITSEKLVLQKPTLPANATHFVNYIMNNLANNDVGKSVIKTSLDSNLQQKVQKILEKRISSLSTKKVNNGAVLVVDHTSGEIIAWVVGNSEINAVLSPRQPGSALKPFLYTTALEKGWNASTIIDDSPYSEIIGMGLHNFKNYSNTFYGKITLREALGNSLNIPALKTIAYVEPKKYLDKLHEAGFASLDKDASFYNEGLALGNGEVSLLELVRGYTMLANKGVYRELSFSAEQKNPESKQVFSEEATSLISNILSDPWARRLEFGGNSVLNLPVQAAVKTGTSTDYRDAWAVGFNHRYVVGVWMGNLDHEPTDGITGATGPALVLRSIFSELNKNSNSRKLYLSPKLEQKDICIDYDNGQPCVMRTEYFMQGREPEEKEKTSTTENFEISRPSDGMQMAYDPRVPSDHQAFEFALSGVADDAKVIWIINGSREEETTGKKYLWPIKRGKFKLSAKVWNDNKWQETKRVSFVVK